MRTRPGLAAAFIYLALPLATHAPDAAGADRAAVVSPPSALRCGNVSLRAEGGAEHLTIRLSLSLGKDEQFSFDSNEPMCVAVAGSTKDDVWLTGCYSAAASSGESLICTGKVTSPNGTVFSFKDVFTVADNKGTFLLGREVGVQSVGKVDEGFMSRFGMTNTVPSQMTDYQFFVPGIWYVDNRHVSPTVLASRVTDEHLFFREDRLPLPLVMMRDKRTGATISLTHFQPCGDTLPQEYGKSVWIDARLQFASLGVYSQKSPAPAILYPGTEGEMTYVLPRFATPGVIVHPGVEARSRGRNSAGPSGSIRCVRGFGIPTKC